MRPARIAVVVAGVALAGVLAWRVTPARTKGFRPMRSVYVAGVARADGPTPKERAPGCGKREHRPLGESFRTASGRTFHVWGPDEYDVSRPYPVVLAFHGWNSSGRGFQRWFEMERHTGGAAFVVYPDADGPQWDYAGARDTDFAAAIVDELATTYCIDRARVLAVGFSYGGRFVNHLGCTRSDLLRAIVVGGGAWDAETGCKPMPVLVLHRTNDPTMRLAGAKDAASRWAKVNGCETDPSVVDPEQGCTAFRGCAAGAVTFCEDAFVDPSWPASWNHTVREPHRALAWSWFLEVP